ncbi:MAG: flavodoxin-dependent (E)-4-hydroxy-3-methylbut-2-enyl-diphosphate synthase [Gammaproteobacteria bacterium]|nr:flavodoxin-dependent (E)-4-hydroxy-3-methylbut-2-enyl-diphosphate synthase [Gammaproteobacteria bacterium]
MDATRKPSRKITREIAIGNVNIGGGNPIAIQSMCVTKTHDVDGTVAQILALEDVGCDIIRVAVPDDRAAAALPDIIRQIHIPLIADIHFNARLAIRSIENGVDKIRINPGNMAADKIDDVLRVATEAGIPVRIGINAGSLERDLVNKYGHPTAEAMVESTLRWLALFEQKGFENIVLSLKSSNVLASIEAQQLVAQKTDYPLHIGVTDAGTLLSGIVKTSIGLSTLLREGIGDTMRVSINEDPVTQVKVAKAILKTLGLRGGEPEVISCSSCGRAEADIRTIALEVEDRATALTEPFKIAVMGCTVSAAGEAREADYGIGCGRGKGAIFKKGIVIKTVPEQELVSELFKLIANDEKKIIEDRKTPAEHRKDPVAV